MKNRWWTRYAMAFAAMMVAAPLAAQGRERIATATDFVKDPGGTVLGRLSVGTILLGGAVKGDWKEVTVDAWILASALRDDNREGFDVSVSPASGTAMRAGPGTGTSFGTLRTGALFKRRETKSGWAHVRRTAWVLRASLASSKPATTVAEKPTTAATPSAPPAATEPTGNTTVSMLSGGTAVADVPSGTAFVTLETPVKAEVLEHRAGWAHVRIEGWVRDGSIGEAPPPGSITAADLRSQPDRYVGQTVEWTLQVIAVQKADELRPELPTGQPYVLARGPLPETGFVYMVIPPDQEATFRGMQPLTKVRVRATVKAGRSKYLQVPVLSFLRKMD